MFIFIISIYLCPVGGLPYSHLGSEISWDLYYSIESNYMILGTRSTLTGKI